MADIWTYFEQRLEHLDDEEFRAAYAKAKELDGDDPLPLHREELRNLELFGQWAAGRRPKWLTETPGRPAQRAPSPRWPRTPGARVRAARAVLGVSQQTLAGSIGLPRSTLGRIERGERPLTFDEAVRIAESLDIVLDALRP